MDPLKSCHIFLLLFRHASCNVGRLVQNISISTGSIAMNICTDNYDPQSMNPHDLADPLTFLLAWYRHLFSSQDELHLAPLSGKNLDYTC